MVGGFCASGKAESEKEKQALGTDLRPTQQS